MLVYSVISSGSCGNCYCFYDGRDSIIVDFGISTKKVTEGLEKAEIPVDSVRGIFLTHLHPDHADKSISVFLKKHPVPLFLNRYSAKKDHHRFAGLNLPQGSLVQFFNTSDSLSLCGFTVRPIEAFHDSPGCVSYSIECAERKICLITDTGYFSQEMIDYSDNSDILFLESNYDDYMLDNGSYDPWLKRRIRSDNGHLSNEQACRMLLKLKENKKRKVFLIHISDENNTLDAVKSASLPALSYNESIIPVLRGDFYRGQLNEQSEE